MKRFTSTPPHAPTENYHIANKKYVDDNIGSGSTSFIFGDASTDGSWKIIVDGSNLVVQRLESGIWVEKNAFTP